MKLYDTPSPENLPAYRKQPFSGNLVNGQGLRQKGAPHPGIPRPVEQGIALDRHE